jgi:FkbM family methyltransferase
MKLSTPSYHSGWWFTLVWSLLWPVRYYLRYFPVQRGKGLLRRLLVLPVLPPAPAQFESVLSGGARIGLQYRETIGLSTLLYGPFEDAELRYLNRLVQPGDNVFDIGANVGLFSVVLGRAVGAQGRVIAAEPVPENAVRAKANFELNQLTNVQLIHAAIGSTEGSIRLNLATDLAYPSVVVVAESRGSGKSIDVPLRTLDNIWLEMGSPPIRFVKIDVEGYELEVLRGAVSLVRQAQPVFLLEANDSVALGQLRQFLDPLGYQFVQPPGFTVHNYLAMPSHLSQKIGTV